MPVLSATGIIVQEPTGYSDTAIFQLTLDEAAPTTTRIYYYTNDGSAAVGDGDYDDRFSHVDIPAGQTSAQVSVTVYGDAVVEGDETFELVILGGQGITLEGGAAALVATATILDSDDTVNTGSPGPGAAAVPILPADPASDVLPTVRVHDVAMIEGEAYSHEHAFLVTLDRPATTPVRIYYYTQDISATGDSDYDDAAGSFTIQPGFQSTYLRVTGYGGTAAESDETFQLVLVAPQNAVFEGGAAALTATATLIDDDGGAPSFPGGVGAPGQQIHGPDGDGGLTPILRVHSPVLIESDDYSQTFRFLMTTDRPAPANISGVMATVDGTASEMLGDYDGRGTSFTFGAGLMSDYVTVTLYGDERIEEDETFGLLFTDLRNARFEGDAPAVVATATILDDDGGPVSGPAGIGDPATGLAAPSGTNDIIPTLQVFDTTMIEGDGYSATIRFPITLDRPAPTEITGSYALMDGTATGEADFDGASGNFAIQAGETSTYLSFTVYGDDQIEGDEFFYLALSNLSNANFNYNAPAMLATGTILDDDAGPVTGAGGIGAPGTGIAGPAPSGNQVTIRVMDTSAAELDSTDNFAYVLVTLSQPAAEDVVMDVATEAGTATADVDYDAFSTRFTIPAGRSSGWVRVRLYDDQSIEGDETLELVFTAVSGGSFENGDNRALITIRGDDGAGSAGDPATGPVYQPYDGPTEADDQVQGTFLADSITGFEGNDSLYGLGGNDTLNGREDNDLLDGGDGDDLLLGGLGGDTILGGPGNDDINGGIGFDMVDGGPGDDTILGGDGFDDLSGGDGNDLINGNNGNDTADGGAGNDTITGGLGADELSGGADDDLLLGQSGFDVLNGDAGNDTLNGNAGGDTLSGGDGDDLLNGGIANDVLSGDAGNDVLNGGNGFDRLDGGAGDDRLEGNAGFDTLAGGTGTDVLRGGIGIDTFVFTLGDGQDRIADFQNNIDVVHIDADLLTETTPVPDDLRNYASFNADGFLVLTFGADSLTFSGVFTTTAVLDDVVFI